MSLTHHNSLLCFFVVPKEMSDNKDTHVYTVIIMHGWCNNYTMIPPDIQFCCMIVLEAIPCAQHFNKLSCIELAGISATKKWKGLEQIRQVLETLSCSAITGQEREVLSGWGRG